MGKSVTERIAFYCDKVHEEVNIILNYGFREDDRIEYHSIDCERKSNCGVYPNTKRKFLKYSWYVCPACKILETDMKRDMYDS